MAVTWLASSQSPITQEKIKGATIVASELISNLGVEGESFPHEIFSFAGAPEYPP